MCGIWASIGNTSEIIDQKSLIRRGPDSSTVVAENDVQLVFHRLAINGLTKESNQPFKVGDTYIMCNGELYNYKQVAQDQDIHLTPDGSDCEILCHLFEKFWNTPQKIFQIIQGEFAIVAVRVSPDGTKSVIAGRDPYGVRPLYWSLQQDHVTFSSLLSGIQGQGHHFPPGNFVQFTMNSINQYVMYPVPQVYYTLGTTDSSAEVVVRTLVNAVESRLMCERSSIGFLLSGGLDSSLIVGIATKILGIKRPKTFSIGMKGSVDLIFAKKVSEYLDTDHTEVTFTQEEAIAVIPEVIKCLETYDITTIRASIGSFLLAKWISENTDIKVLLNGDGSDEVACGYLYNYYAPSALDAHADALRLLKEIHMYDGLRVDRTISHHGIEARVPFLDPLYVEAYLSIPVALRVPSESQMEKQFLRDAFRSSGVLPHEVLYRRKEAFSDGVSSSGTKEMSMIDHIKEFTKGKESEFYKKIFMESFPNNLHIIPRYWMPKWTSETNDPSARTLKIYESR